jgi:hypothetical protein
MTEVTKEQFYAFIGPLDVVLNITTSFPYTTDFKLRNGTIKGRSIDSYTDPAKKLYPIIEKFYINQ